MCTKPLEQEADCVARFLDSIRQPDLPAWLGVSGDASPPVLRKAIDDRRRWAQGHQANPRHREQALWIIKHHRRVVQALVGTPGGLERLDAAIAHARAQSLVSQVEALAEGDAGAVRLQRLRERLGVRPPPTSNPARPHLDRLMRLGLEAGLPPAKLDGMVRVHRSHGLPDEQIALLLLDELKREGIRLD